MLSCSFFRLLLETPFLLISLALFFKDLQPDLFTRPKAHFQKTQILATNQTPDSIRFQDVCKTLAINLKCLTGPVYEDFSARGMGNSD